MVLKLSTGKSSKILIHGTSKTWHIPHDAWKIIKENHYEWTAHSHPTMTKIIASPEDRETLKLFTWQEKSIIIPSLTVGKIKMATNPVNMGSVAVFYFVTICAIL